MPLVADGDGSLTSAKQSRREWLQMSVKEEPMKGSCECGAVRYEIDQLDSPIEHCYCRTCRKSHAAAFNSAALVDRKHFRWLQGQDKLSSFQSSAGKLRKFCSVCGSHLIADRADRPYVFLRVATLDEDPGFGPTFGIWGSHRVPWLQNEGLRCFPEDPPDGERITDKFLSKSSGQA